MILTLGLVVLDLFYSSYRNNTPKKQMVKSLFLPLSLLITMLLFLSFVAYQLFTNSGNNFAGVDQEYGFFEGLIQHTIDSVIYYSRPVFTRYLFCIILIGIFYYQFRKSQLLLLVISVFTGGLFCAAVFYNAIDGFQFFSNGFMGLLLAFLALSPVVFNAKQQLTLLVLVLIYTGIYVTNFEVEMIEQDADEICLPDSKRLLFGTVSNSEDYLDPYLSNPIINSAGNYVLNFSNKIPVNLQSFSHHIADESLPAAIRQRLGMNFLDQILTNDKIYESKSDFMKKEIDFVIADKKVKSFDHPDFKLECENDQVLYYSRNIQK